MKIRYLLPLFTLLSLGASAQTPTADSLIRPLLGVHAWVDFGLNENQSLRQISSQLAPLGITQRGTRLSAFGASSYRRMRRHDGEFRLWGMSNNDEYVTDPAVRGARIEGFGLGLLGTYRLVDTRRFMLGPGLGYDFQFYRLRIDAPTPGAVPIQTILSNPSAYESTRLNGFGLTANLALTAGYKFKLFKRSYEYWQLTGRVGYHLPVLYTREWAFDQTPVTGLDAYRPSALYGSIGLIGFWRHDYLDRARRRYR
jgi:hypothetical protein